MIIFLYGVDTFRSRQKLLELKARFLKEVDSSGLNLVELDGATLSLDEFHAAVSTVSFLAKKRMIIVKQVMEKNSKMASQLAEMLLSWQDKGISSPDVLLVFWEATSASKNSLFQLLRKQKFVQEFKSLRTYQLQEWIVHQVGLLGGSIQKQAVSCLVALIGSDLSLLAHEIQKLVALTRGTSITKDHLDLMTKGRYDSSIFLMVDALCKKDISSFFRLLHEQRMQGSHDLYILTMLIRQFRLMLLLQEYCILYPEASNAKIASDLRLSPFVVQKTRFPLKYFKKEEILSLYQTFLEIDEDIKAGKKNPLLAIDYGILQTLYRLGVLKGVSQEKFIFRSLQPASS